MRWIAALALFGPPAGDAAEAEAEAASASESEPEADEPDAESEAESESEAEAEAEPAPKKVSPPPRKRATPPPPPDYNPDSGVPPGGYWEPGEAPEIAPKDGEEELLVAYILLPLAALTTASAAASLWLTAPGHCPERLQLIGADATAGECRSLLIVNAIRTSYGLAGLVTGAVLLGIGLHRKKQYEVWKKRNFRASLGFRPTGASLRIRF
jgi:hypothetical protein